MEENNILHCLLTLFDLSVEQTNNLNYLSEHPKKIINCEIFKKLFNKVSSISIVDYDEYDFLFNKLKHI